ncbi:hypothetical protein [Salinicola sp. CPA57]|uniref:hypothetical protein n=1 Tax=Salinicola sp. CPA57 TaxID=1949080 RepID=UPI000DA1C8F1|nr:hypothetical protein [Salinicola sp. CPA57]
MTTRVQSLLDWLKVATRQDIRATGTTRSYLRLIAYGHKRASLEVAVRTETTSGARVTRKQLRPHDWHIMWPELARPDFNQES